MAAQCKSCPWRTTTVPDRDIPNGYSEERHRALFASTIEGTSSMACHHSMVGSEVACAGWLHYMLGQGNSIRVRLAVLWGSLPVPEVDGPQHVTFEATLPRKKEDDR